MTGSDASEGQAVWQPGGAEEDSRLCEGNRHLHLAYDEEEDVDQFPALPSGALPVTRPAYPSVFAHISTEIGRQYGSTPVFLKYGHRVSRKDGYRNLLPAKLIVVH